MNNGKICISVCAATGDELIEQINRAEKLADVIEIRFDCLEKEEFNATLQKIDKIRFGKPFLATFRPKHDLALFFVSPFGEDVNSDKKEKIKLALEYRKSGWREISGLKNVDLVDFETDIQAISSLKTNNFIEKSERIFSEKADKELRQKKIIVSEHFFENVPENLSEIYEEMKSEENDEIRSDIIKIAAQADDITDTIPIWKLLSRANSESQPFIPIAMGEAGKWTRILGLAHGAFMTYAALSSGSETAPGQVTAEDLINVYRAKELNEETEVYGVLGSNTSVSMSPYIHNAAFKYNDLNAVFLPLQVQNLDEFIRRMVKSESREIDLNFKGFAVTIPHKQAIIEHLDFVDETARQIGAVNTVKITGGKLHGYNTDADGFIEPLLNSYGDLTDAHVAVIGAGGAARACVYALKKQGAEVTVFARNPEKSQKLAEDFEVEIKALTKTEDQNPKADFSDFQILVNTTPLGMKGKADGETPATADQLKNLHLVYDLIYIPFQTPLMEEADRAEIPKIGGLAMLVAQAARQQKIWTGIDAPAIEMSRAALAKLP